MSPQTVAMILKRFEEPDEVRAMTLGRFELVRLGGMTLGRATYQPGWRWSEFADSRVIEMRAGDLFYIPPEPHDSWVLGNEPYVSLHFLGADHYAK